MTSTMTPALGLEDALRDVASLLGEALADAAVTWTLGGFGALASFARRPADPLARLGSGRLGLTTERGGIAFSPEGIVPVAYETAFGESWSLTVALCLAEAESPAPRSPVLIELGPDAQALRERDREAILFDAGLALPQAAFCLRSADPSTVGRLRAACGAPIPYAALRERDATLDKVVAAPRGRIEVYGGGPGHRPDDPLVPRTFVDGQTLRARRSHAATAPIPAGLVPFAHLQLPAGADRRRGTALLARWGDPGLVALKDALARGEPMPAAAGRHARMVEKVVRAQDRAGMRRRESD